MKFYSTNNKNNQVTFKQAVLQGMADDGGLFMPTDLPRLSNNFFLNIGNRSFIDIALEVSKEFVYPDIPPSVLQSILIDAYNFDAPLVNLDDQIKVLELFHGPTLAFKDFGARFMARTVSFLNRDNSKEVTILVATSGDTGSAVAKGFFNQDGIRVILLYPSGMVSEIQEKQLTTLGGNVKALEVLGTFDDCQQLVKTAFLDDVIKAGLRLSSANSINIARLIPQTFYYFSAYAQLKNKDIAPIFSVPSGNLGNLTAGLFAKEMGLPLSKFIAALNANDVFGNYLKHGNYQPQKAIPTISNAMDVGNPGNFARILALYRKNRDVINSIIFCRSFSDDKTREAIAQIYSKYNYVMDPHGAVGYLALQEYLNKFHLQNYQGIILETAHPGKFSDTVKEALSIEVEIPQRLQSCLARKKQAIKISKEFADFKEFLLGA